MSAILAEHVLRHSPQDHKQAQVRRLSSPLATTCQCRRESRPNFPRGAPVKREEEQQPTPAQLWNPGTGSTIWEEARGCCVRDNTHRITQSCRATLPSPPTKPQTRNSKTWLASAYSASPMTPAPEPPGHAIQACERMQNPKKSNLSCGRSRRDQ